MASVQLLCLLIHLLTDWTNIKTQYDGKAGSGTRDLALNVISALVETNLEKEIYKSDESSNREGRPVVIPREGGSIPGGGVREVPLWK